MRKYSNIGWLFYKDYFCNEENIKIMQKENGKDVEKEISHKISYDYLFEDKEKRETDDTAKKSKERNEKLLKVKNSKLINETSFYEITNVCAKHKFSLKIQYPGLVTGIGINHEINVAGEFKLGVHFDYTYGMPVVYGSSVKGMLRSVFPADNTKHKNAAKVEYLNKKMGTAFDEKALIALRDNIFDNKDVFFDAVIVKPFKKGNREIFLETDSLAPHGDNPLKNPVPLSFLKIASGVTMEFRFDLKDGIISAAKKMELFQHILKDFGVGAKTNVGYGQFS